MRIWDNVWAFIIWSFYWTAGAAIHVHHDASEEAQATSTDGEFYLKFDLCGSWINQRLALIHGLAIGSIMQATIFLPDLISTRGEPRALRDVYDEDFLKRRLKETTQFANASLASRQKRQNLLGDLQWKQSEVLTAGGLALKAYPLTKWLALRHDFVQRGWNAVSLDCTYNALVAVQDPKAVNLLWHIESALRFAPPIVRLADKFVAKLQEGGDGGFTAMGLRVDREWVGHCLSGDAGNWTNCMANEDVLHDVLAIERVPVKDPIFVPGKPGMAGLLMDDRFKQLRGSYKMFTKEDLLSEGQMHVDGKRAQPEAFEFVDYEICHRAKLFIGNSLDPFSAMIELHRRKVGPPKLPPAFHYNGGPIPLATMMPVSPTSVDGNFPEMMGRHIKWVFALSVDSNPVYFKHAQVAVRSALANTSLVPYCIMVGTKGVPTQAEKWLIGMGVVVIRHTPQWANQTAANFHAAGGGEEAGGWNTANDMIASLVRFDIPVLGFVDRYVLYTDADVIFLRDPNFGDFGRELPMTFSIGTELKAGTGFKVQGTSRVNAGVLLLNIPAMRASHDKFIQATFAGHHTDSKEAYLSFYNMSTVAAPLFNWRPYWQTTDAEWSSIAVVHFNGPKIGDYDKFLKGKYGMGKGMDLLAECKESMATCKGWLSIWVAIAKCIEGCPALPRAAQLKKTARLTSNFGGGQFRGAAEAPSGKSSKPRR